MGIWDWDDHSVPRDHSVRDPAAPIKGSAMMHFRVVKNRGFRRNRAAISSEMGV